MLERNNEIIKEVSDEIEASLKDSKGIQSHQRRIAFSLSIEVVALIENYLDKLNVFKAGGKINHRWFKKKRENVKELISNQITSPIDSIEKINEILDIAYNIEKERNELAYGKPASEETLKDKINLFLDLKRRLENA